MTVKMQRRHFEKVAEAIRMAEPPKVEKGEWMGWYMTALSVADSLAPCNERFDKARFIKAATGVEA